MNNNTRAIIAHPYPLFRLSITNIIQRNSNKTVVKELDNYKDVLTTWTPENNFDILFIGDNLNGVNCFCKIKDLISQHPADVIMISSNSDSTFSDRLAGIGVRGLLSHDMTEEHLMIAVDQLNNEEPWIQPKKISHSLYCPEEALTRLSKSEHRVLNLLCEGLPNKKIAQSLYIAESTVKTHVSNILYKFGINNRTLLAKELNQLPTYR